MPRVPLDNVRVLSLREIASMFAEEAKIPESVMLRELRWAVLNIPRLNAGDELLEMPPPDEELPDPDQRVNREWLVEFCHKQGWAEPEFWFGRQNGNDRYAGRPSVKPSIMQELERRAENGQLAESLAEQARQLLGWAKGAFPGDNALPSTAHTVENQIRNRYRQLKQADT